MDYTGLILGLRPSNAYRNKQSIKWTGNFLAAYLLSNTKTRDFTIYDQRVFLDHSFCCIIRHWSILAVKGTAIKQIKVITADIFLQQSTGANGHVDSKYKISK